MVLAENISEEVAFRFILKGEGCEPGQGQALCSQSISNSWVSVNRWRKKDGEKHQDPETWENHHDGHRKKMRARQA